MDDYTHSTPLKSSLTHPHNGHVNGDSFDETTLIFLHLLKTGGRTLASILKKNYGNEGRFHYGVRPGETLEDLQQLPEEKRRSLRLIHGHLHFGIHTFIPQSSTYITLLRNPIERVISHYYYALHNPQHYTHQLVNEKKMSLADYVSDGIIDLDNGQTRRIAGDWAQHIPFGECHSELLATAKQNLNNHFSLVGITERFDEFLVLLKHQFRLTQVLYTHSNVTPSRPKLTDISDEDIALIKHYNQLDLDLYDYASRLFQKQVEAAGSSFYIELNLLQQFNAQYADLQFEVKGIKEKFSSVRKTLKEVRRDAKQLRADVQHQTEAVNAIQQSLGGKLWARWKS